MSLDSFMKYVKENDQKKKEAKEKGIQVPLKFQQKKIRDTKGTLHAKLSLIKDRNCIDLTEAEDIKKRWKDPDNDDGAISHLEPDILECEVK